VPTTRRKRVPHFNGTRARRRQMNGPCVSAPQPAHAKSRGPDTRARKPFHGITFQGVYSRWHYFKFIVKFTIPAGTPTNERTV
jgi:hypothetical protein